MKQNYVKLIIFSSLIIIFGIFVFFLCREFLFSKSVNLDTAISFHPILGSQEITIENRLPISDEVGRQLRYEKENNFSYHYLDFSVKSEVNRKMKYEIYLTKNSVEKEIKSNYIKCYLTDDLDNPVEGYEQNQLPSYYDLKLAKSDISGKLLYSGSLKAREQKNFRLRMWLSDSYVVSSENRSFSIQLKVKGV